MPKVFTYKGYRFFFFSDERNEPPHIHVEFGNKYAKFWLEPVILVNTRGFNAPELRKVREIIEENFDMIRGKWDEHFNR
jgi:hypothetical protein